MTTADQVLDDQKLSLAVAGILATLMKVEPKARLDVLAVATDAAVKAGILDDYAR